MLVVRVSCLSYVNKMKLERESCRVRIKFLLTSYQQTTHSTYFTRRLRFFFSFLLRQMLSKHFPSHPLFFITRNYLLLPVLLYFPCGQRHSKMVVKHCLSYQETCSVKTGQVMNGSVITRRRYERNPSRWPLIKIYFFISAQSSVILLTLFNHAFSKGVSHEKWMNNLC